VPVLLVEAIFILLVSFYVGYGVFALIYGRKVLYKTNTSYSPMVSIVVPTCDEESNIRKKIDDLLKIDYPRDKLEIIFVDSSRDKTGEIIQEFRQWSPIRVSLLEEPERRGLAAAVNKGYAAASGEIVMKSDCDVILRNDFVRNIVSYFSHSNIGAVSGAAEVINRSIDRSIINRSKTEVGYRSIFEKLKLAEANLDSTYVFNAFAFRRELFELIDEKSVADDTELALRIRKKGYRAIYAPDAIIYDPSPTEIKTRIKQKSRRAQGVIRLSCQNLKVLFNPRYGRFGMFIFPANFFMIVVLPWLILLELALTSYWLYRSCYPLSIFIILALAIALVTIYLKSKPKLLAGFIEAQLSLLIGSITLLIRGPQFSWKKLPER
jgi:cellulose synthase/poly-beta-1,6-N-acetylglucosamine synthase-like glycosyltransferase